MAVQTDALARRRRNVGRLMSVCALWFQGRVIDTLQKRGHKRLRAVHNGVLANMSLEGSQLSDIARRAGITRQAVGQVVDDLVALGYVARVRDPDDGRGRLIKYTKRGQHALDDGLKVIDAIEDEIETLLGERSFLALKRSLEKIIERYRLEDAMP